MKKRILLGSIFAVVILIFLSFNNVVGYRNSNSNLVHKSPLFDIRTSRAIEQDKSPYFNNYIGKGEKTNIYFSEKDNEKYLLCNFVEEISQMDKKTFNNFKTEIISQLNKDEKIKEIGLHNVLLVINLMRMHPDEIKGYILNEEEGRPQFIITLGLFIFILYFIIGPVVGFLAMMIYASFLICTMMCSYTLTYPECYP